MSNGWESALLGDLVDSERGISYGIVQPGSHTPGGIPIVRVNDIKNGRVQTDSPLLVDATIEAKYRRTRLRGGEVLLTLVGSVGQSAIAPQELRGWNTARAIGVIPVKDVIGAQWVRLCLQSPQAQHFIKTWCTTTVQATFNLQDVARLPIPIPPPQVREAIASILGALDDKIECNRRINQTLEAMAQALYKHWFVDFGPFRDGEFVDSELGEIPSGWSVGKLSDILSLRRESIDPGEQTRRLAYVPIDCIPMRSLGLSESKDGEEAQSSLILFYAGDILFGAMRAYFHRVCIAPFAGVTRTTTFVLSTRQEYDFAFALLTMNQDTTIDFADSHSKGSTIPYAVWDGSLAEMPIVLPPLEIREKFNTTVQSMLWQIANSVFENQTLTRTRDYLLPKLLSGEVEVRVAE